MTEKTLYDKRISGQMTGRFYFYEEDIKKTLKKILGEIEKKLRKNVIFRKNIAKEQNEESSYYYSRIYGNDLLRAGTRIEELREIKKLIKSKFGEELVE